MTGLLNLVQSHRGIYTNQIAADSSADGVFSDICVEKRQHENAYTKNTVIRHGALKVGLILSAILTLGGFMLGATVIYELPVSHETGTWLFVGWMVLQTVILRLIEWKVTGR